MTRISDEERKDLIRRLQEPGATARGVARDTEHNKNTLMQLARTLPKPRCPCGNVSGHKGWCEWRYLRSVKRQEYQASRRRMNIGSVASVSYDPRRCNNWCFQFTQCRSSDYRSCAWRGCIWPALSGSNECRIHAHYFDYPFSMTDCSISADMFIPDPEDASYSPPLSLINNDKFDDGNFRTVWSFHVPAKELPVKDAVANYSRSSGRMGMRSAGGTHTSSKTTRGRKRQASHQQGRGDTKEKRWSRETIETPLSEQPQ